jgi:hypothetical protein
MKYFVYLILVVSFYSKANAQNSKTDSLKLLLEKAPNDTNRVKLLLEIGSQYYFFKPDTSFHFTKKALELSRNLHYTKGIISPAFRGLSHLIENATGSIGIKQKNERLLW